MDFPLVIPDDYFKGEDSSFDFPSDVLLFTRRDRAGLDNSSSHRHSRFNFIAALDGDCNLLIDREILHIPGGGVLLIHPWQNFRFLYNENQPLKWLFFGFDCPSLDRGYSRGKVRMQTPFFFRMCQQLLERYGNEGAGPWLVPYLALLINELPQLPFQKGDTLPAFTGESELVLKVQRFIYDNMDRPVSISDIAAHCAYSESRLRALFKSLTDISLGSYLGQVKINESARMMVQTSLPVSRVAEACGFGSLYAFSRAFKKATGLSPIAYRRCNR